jgi:hypothetical protein
MTMLASIDSALHRHHTHMHKTASAHNTHKHAHAHPHPKITAWLEAGQHTTPNVRNPSPPATYTPHATPPQSLHGRMGAAAANTPPMTVGGYRALSRYTWFSACLFGLTLTIDAVTSRGLPCVCLAFQSRLYLCTGCGA